MGHFLEVVLSADGMSGLRYQPGATRPDQFLQRTEPGSALATERRATPCPPAGGPWRQGGLG